MLSDFYIYIDVYEVSVEEDDWGNISEDANIWVYDKTIKGLIEPKSGSSSWSNNRVEYEIDYILYTEAVLNNQQRIKYNDTFYNIVLISYSGNIGSSPHYEIGLRTINEYNDD